MTIFKTELKYSIGIYKLSIVAILITRPERVNIIWSECHPRDANDLGKASICTNVRHRSRPSRLGDRFLAREDDTHHI